MMQASTRKNYHRQWDRDPNWNLPKPKQNKQQRPNNILCLSCRHLVKGFFKVHCEDQAFYPLFFARSTASLTTTTPSRIYLSQMNVEQLDAIIESITLVNLAIITQLPLDYTNNPIEKWISNSPQKRGYLLQRIIVMKYTIFIYLTFLFTSLRVWLSSL